jgi:hypothetical protein
MTALLKRRIKRCLSVSAVDGAEERGKVGVDEESESRKPEIRHALEIVREGRGNWLSFV